MQRYDDLLISDPQTRVSAVLLRLAGYENDPADPFADPKIPMTQTEIADITRLTRNGLAGILSRLAADGMVSTNYAHVTINDAPALMHIMRDGH
jgi:CRP-like cAMP-binding protein